MEDCEQQIIYNILINKTEEERINKVLSCITKKDFPALITFKNCLGRIGNLNNIKQNILNEYNHIEQVLNLYKKRIVICYILNLLNDDFINKKTPINEVIEYLKNISNNNSIIEQQKEEIRKMIEISKNEDKIILGKKYKQLTNNIKKLDYKKLINLFSFNINSIDNTLKDKYIINFKIEDDVENEIIYNALKTLSRCKNKNVEVTINKINAKKLEKKL